MPQIDLQALIPIVAILCTFGVVPATLYVVRHFRFKERELQLEQEAQRWAERNYAALEARVQRLESALPASGERPPQREAELLARLEGPATTAADESARLPPLKTR